jgi:hypothetical protein
MPHRLCATAKTRAIVFIPPIVLANTVVQRRRAYCAGGR